MDKLLFKTLIVSAYLLTLLFVHDAAFAQNPFLDFIKGTAPKQYFIKTEDDWTLSLYRYMPEKIDRRREPVILCHGFNYNSYFWDLDERHSFAYYMYNSIQNIFIYSYQERKNDIEKQ